MNYVFVLYTQLTKGTLRRLPQRRLSEQSVLESRTTRESITMVTGIMELAFEPLKETFSHTSHDC